MKEPRHPLLLAAIVGPVAALVSLAACSHRSGFDGSPDPFQDASLVEASVCLFQCSLDGRSVVDCNGKVVSTCSDDQACGAALCQEPCAAAAADKSSNGCEFYFQPPLFTKLGGTGCYAAYIVNSTNKPSNLALELKGQPLDISKSVFTTNAGDPTLIAHAGPVLPGESAILFVSDALPDDETDVTKCPKGVVPATYQDALPEGTGFGDSFHLTSDLPVGIAAVYPFGGAPSYLPSGTLLLPVATWGTQHIIVNAWEAIGAFGSASSGPAAQIVASEDDTDVTIKPNHDIQDGADVIGTAANTTVTYHLNRGQLLQIDQAEELSGSIVTTTKPTSIFGGHECMFIPSTRYACDIALQQIPAFANWGSEYTSVGYRPRAGNEAELMPYRIVAARDGTQLDYDPVNPSGAPVTMSAGQVVTFWTGVGDAFVVRTQDSDHPIYLAAFMSGGGAPNEPDILGPETMDGVGDPEFVNVIPAGQYLNSYTFFADPTYGDTSLVVIRGKTNGKFEDVWLDCAGQNLTGWKPVGTRGNYEWLRADLAVGGGPGQAFGANVCKNGLQKMHSAGAFTATLWGWGGYARYACPGGTAQRKLVPTALPPVK